MKTENDHINQSEQESQKRLAQRAAQLLEKRRLPLPADEPVTIILYSTRPEWTTVCLATLLECTRQHGQIFVVFENDNCSNHFAEKHHEWGNQRDLSVHFLKCIPAVNMYNLALSQVNTAFVVLLVDSVIATPDWLTRLLWPFFDDYSVRITGSCSNIEWNTASRDAFPVSTISEVFEYDRTLQQTRIGSWEFVPFLDWRCLVCDRSLFAQIGGLDFTFRTLEMRLTDWILRAKQTDCTLVLCHDVYLHVLHSQYPGTQPTETTNDWNRFCQKWEIDESENKAAFLTTPTKTNLPQTRRMIPLTKEELSPPMVTLLLLDRGEPSPVFQKLLHSLEQQTYSHLEIIHLHLGNGSRRLTRLSRQIAATISLPKHKLTKQLLQSAWSLAKGTYIAYMQAGYIYQDNHLANLIDSVHQVRATAGYIADETLIEMPLSCLIHLQPGGFDVMNELLEDGRVRLRRLDRLDMVRIKNQTIQAAIGAKGS